MKNSYRYFKNESCQYYPCHKGLDNDNFNCLFCYCPLNCYEQCPGKPDYFESNGKRIKDCSGCTFPHRAENYGAVIKALRHLMGLNG